MTTAPGTVGDEGNVATAISLSRLLIAGGAGALMPALLSLAVLDLRTTLVGTDGLALLGYATRVAALFLIGALTAWMHKQECDERKLFQLGIAGPALFTTWLTGAQVPVPARARAPIDGPEMRVSVSALFVPPLHAQPPAPPSASPRIYSFEDAPPRPDAGDRFLQGFLGKAPSERPYFVVLKGELYADSLAAYRRVRAVRGMDDDFRDAQVFRSPDRGGYVVVLGGWLSDKGSRELLDEVKEERLVARVVTRATASEVRRPRAAHPAPGAPPGAPPGVEAPR